MSLREGSSGWADTQARVLAGGRGPRLNRGSQGYETYDQMMDRLDRERKAREIPTITSSAGQVATVVA